MQITHDLAIGGLQQVVLNLCRTINTERFQTTVLCLRALGPLVGEIERLGIKVILLPPKKSGTDYFSFVKVADILRRERIQVIHTHNTQPLVDGVLGATLSGGGQRIIHTDHARQFPDKIRYMVAEWCMSHFVHKMVGVSEQTTLNLLRYEKISHKKLMTIENGIDGSRFAVRIDRRAKQRELGISLAGPVIGVISRLEKVKGITYLIKALPEIIRHFPDLTLLVVGEGSELFTLQLETSQLGVEDHVIFTGVRHDIPDIFQLLDLYLLPSLSEGLPMGLLEAMAAGCPVIASRVGGIPGTVIHNKEAILVRPGAPDALTQATIRLLENHELREGLSRNLKKKFHMHYSAAIMTRKYCDLYVG